MGLFYMDTNAKTENPLLVSTPASKCAWSISGKSIVCAVARSSSLGDEFYDIKLEGTKELILSPNSKIDTAEIFLSGAEDYLIILNGLDDHLYVLKR